MEQTRRMYIEKLTWDGIIASQEKYKGGVAEVIDDSMVQRAVVSSIGRNNPYVEIIYEAGMVNYRLSSSWWKTEASKMSFLDRSILLSEISASNPRTISYFVISGPMMLSDERIRFLMFPTKPGKTHTQSLQITLFPKGFTGSDLTLLRH